MPDMVALPVRGEVFLDARRDGHVLRVSPHPKDGVVVVSIWRGEHCAASFRIPDAEVDDVVGALLAAVRPA